MQAPGSHPVCVSTSGPAGEAAPELRWSPEEFDSVFRLFDSDGDGCISLPEVESALMALRELLEPADAEALRAVAGRRGMLDRADFLAWVCQRPAFDISRYLRDLFVLVDSDGHGSLSRDEWALMLAVLDPSLSLEQADALLRRHDVDGSGTISYREFLTLLSREPGLRVSLADLQRLKKTLVHYSSAARSTRIGLVEVDCDLGAGIPGAGSGIALLRQALERQLSLREVAIDLFEDLRDQQRGTARAGAGGDRDATPHARHIAAIAAVMEQAATLVASTCERGLFPVVLAGDHSTAAGTIAGLRRAHPQERLGVIWIDAHADIHSPYTTPSGNMHGMPLAVASDHDNHAEAINSPDSGTTALWESLKRLHGSGEPAINLADLVYVAVRDTEPAEDATITAHAIPVIRTEDLRRIGPEQAAQHCLQHLDQVDRIYISFDVDSMDATICKGTGTPSPGGLWADEAVRLTRTLLRDPRVCCWEICEINPHLDTLNSIGELSLGIFSAVVEELDARS